MVKKSHGTRRKTRRKFQKKARERGMVPVARFFRVFEEGDRVLIKVEPSQHGGMPYKGFHGKIGVVKGKRGGAYLVEVSDKNAKKTVIAGPIHMRKMT